MRRPIPATKTLIVWVDLVIEHVSPNNDNNKEDHSKDPTTIALGIQVKSESVFFLYLITSSFLESNCFCRTIFLFVFK